MTNSRSVVALLLAALLFTACDQPTVTTTSSGQFKLGVRVEPEPPAVGATVLIATLKDAYGAAVDGARLMLHADMDHEGMTQVDLEISESLGGEYRIPFEWTMGGGWILTITAQTPEGDAVSETFHYFVEAVSSESIINRHATSDSPRVQIGYRSDSDPAHLGDAVVTINVLDMSGAPVTDASVSVRGDMDHQGMMPVTGIGSHIGEGQYRVPIRWTMVGDWQVAVTVTLADGQAIEQVYDQKVVIP